MILLVKPSHSGALLFICAPTFFSSSHYYSPLLFAMLPPLFAILSFSGCYFHVCVVAFLSFSRYCFPLLFAMLFSYLHCCSFLCHIIVLLFVLKYKFFHGCFSSTSYCFCVVICWRILCHPLPFPLIRLIGSCQESTTCVLFPPFFFHVFCSSILIVFYFGLWCKAGLGMNCFGDKHKPIENIFYNFVSLFICKCFGSFLVVHRSFVNVLHHT